MAMRDGKAEVMVHGEDFSQALAAIGVDVWVPAAVNSYEQAGHLSVTPADTLLADNYLVVHTSTGQSISVCVEYAPGQSDLKSLELDLINNMFKAIGCESGVARLRSDALTENTGVAIILGQLQAERLLDGVSRHAQGSLQSIADKPVQPTFITHAPYQVLANPSLKRPVWKVLQQLQQTVTAL